MFRTRDRSARGALAPYTRHSPASQPRSPQRLCPDSWPRCRGADRQPPASGAPEAFPSDTGRRGGAPQPHVRISTMSRPRKQPDNAEAPHPGPVADPAEKMHKETKCRRGSVPRNVVLCDPRVSGLICRARSQIELWGRLQELLRISEWGWRSRKTSPGCLQAWGPEASPGRHVPGATATEPATQVT